MSTRTIGTEAGREAQVLADTKGGPLLFFHGDCQRRTSRRLWDCLVMSSLLHAPTENRAWVRLDDVDTATRALTCGAQCCFAQVPSFAGVRVKGWRFICPHERDPSIPATGRGERESYGLLLMDTHAPSDAGERGRHVHVALRPLGRADGLTL